MRRDNYPLHIVLFLLTLLTTTVAGAEQALAKIAFPAWLFGVEHDPKVMIGPSDLWAGLPFALAFTAFLTTHEFGHYFMARYHKIKTSLPYYIPIFIPIPGFFNIGSFGAVIRLRETPPTTKKFFDVGIAGPLAGFVVALGILIYGFATLPPQQEFIYSIHTDYAKDFGHVPTQQELQQKYADGEDLGSVALGTNLLYTVLSKVIPNDPSRVPPAHEMMHYPFLMVGFLTLFFTALNLLPIGQLDGGHVMYGLLGHKRAHLVSRLAVMGLLCAGGAGFVNFSGLAGMEVAEGSFGTLLGARLEALGDLAQRILGVPLWGLFMWFILRRLMKEWTGRRVLMLTLGLLAFQALLCLVFPSLLASGVWLVYSFLAVRVLGTEHPPAQQEEPIGLGRKVLGVVAILIFILCFSPAPLTMF
jgi:membrane-associated protease RseP (regulator of RpoE activity)